jgi:hypothetical protein
MSVKMAVVGGLCVDDHLLRDKAQLKITGEKGEIRKKMITADTVNSQKAEGRLVGLPLRRAQGELAQLDGSR